MEKPFTANLRQCLTISSLDRGRKKVGSAGRLPFYFVFAAATIRHLFSSWGNIAHSL
jgi:hypothetical protein